MVLCEYVAMLSLTLRGNQLDAVIGFVSAVREGSDVCVLIVVRLHLRVKTRMKSRVAVVRVGKEARRHRVVTMTPSLSDNANHLRQ